MLAQMLLNSGLDLGDELVPANPSNPDGHFEDRNIVQLHDDILVDNDTSWKYIGNGDLLVSTEHQSKIHEVAESLNLQSRSRGFKDPRACLFLNEWSQCLDNPVGIFIYRDFISCLQSLKARQAMQITYSSKPKLVEQEFWEDEELALRMWLAYNKSIINFVHSQQCPTIVVAQEELVNGVPFLEMVNRQLDLSFDTSQPTGIRRGIGSAKARYLQVIDSPLNRELNEALSELDHLSVTEIGVRAKCKVYVPSQDRELNTAHLELVAQLDRILGTSQQEVEIVRDKLSQLPIEGGCIDEILEGVELVNKYLKEGSYSLAIKYILESIDTGSYDKRLLIKLGLAYCKLEDYKSAKEYLLLAAHYLPKNANVFLQLAIVSLKTDDIEGANNWLYKSHELSPDLRRPVEMLTSNQRAIGNIDEAKRLGKVLLEKHPNCLSSYRLYCRVLLENNQLEDAMTYVCRGIEKFPTDPSLWNLKMLLLRERGALVESEECYFNSIATKLQASQSYRDQLQNKIQALMLEGDKTPLLVSVVSHLMKIPSKSIFTS